MKLSRDAWEQKNSAEISGPRSLIEWVRDRLFQSGLEGHEKLEQSTNLKPAWQKKAYEEQLNKTTEQFSNRKQSHTESTQEMIKGVEVSAQILAARHAHFFIRQRWREPHAIAHPIVSSQMLVGARNIPSIHLEDVSPKKSIPASTKFFALVFAVLEFFPVDVRIRIRQEDEDVVVVLDKPADTPLRDSCDKEAMDSSQRDKLENTLLELLGPVDEPKFANTVWGNLRFEINDTGPNKPRKKTSRRKKQTYKKNSKKS